jgi:hypothetical protein
MGIVLCIFIFRRQMSTILNKKKCTMLFEKKKVMFICQKLDARTFFYLVGIEVSSKLFHLMCHLFKSDKKISKIQHQRFFVSHPVYRVFSKLRRSLSHEVLCIILKNFTLNLLSKMFVLTEIIDCIFLLFSKILSPILSISIFLNFRFTYKSN